MRRQDAFGESGLELEEIVEMPEGPGELATGDAPLAVREGQRSAVQRVALREGESAAEAFRRVQRERSGAGAVFVIRLETP